jgi:hypothetical protein
MGDILFHGEKYVSLATGTKVSRNHGFPNVLDMAWQMGRICRWTGAGEFFWSDMLHSFVVADLVSEPWLKCHALIHDGCECVGNDVPSPVKSDETRKIEHAIMERTWHGLGLWRLNAAEEAVIKVADNRARNGEAWVIGNDGNRGSYPDRDKEAEYLVTMYLNDFPYTQTIERGGQGPREFLKRYHEYWRLAQSGS